MTNARNSEIEKYYFELFRRAYVLPEGEIYYTDKPDVIVRGTRTLGIEITNLYIAPGEDDASEQVQRHRRAQVLEQAQKAFLASGGKKIEISADFNPDKPIYQIRPIIEALVQFIHQLKDEPTGQVSRTLFEHIEPLRFVYLNMTEYDDAKWRPIQSFSVPNLSVPRLRKVVAEKSGKLSSYQPCDRYWLLAVVDFMDAAQDQHLEWPIDECLGESLYEKVLLFKPQFGQVLEVPR